VNKKVHESWIIPIKPESKEEETDTYLMTQNNSHKYGFLTYSPYWEVGKSNITLLNPFTLETVATLQKPNHTKKIRNPSVSNRGRRSIVMRVMLV